MIRFPTRLFQSLLPTLVVIAASQTVCIAQEIPEAVPPSENALGGAELVVSKQDKELLRTIQAKLLQRLTSQFSGSFTGTWTMVTEKPPSREIRTTSGRVRGMFNDAIECYAIQRGVPGYDYSLHQPKRAEYALVWTPSLTARYGESNHMIKIRSAADRSSSGMDPLGERIDPRLFGVALYGNILRGDTLTATLAGRFLRDNPTRVVHEDLDRLRVEWTTAGRERIIWIKDPNTNPLPAGYQRRERYPDVDDNMWLPPSETQTVAYETIGDLVVPKTFKIVLIDPVQIGPVIPKTRAERVFSTETHDITLEWSRVNENIPESEFTEKWIDPTTRVLISDERPAGPNILADTGNPNVGKEPKIELVDLTQSARQNPRNPWWPWVMGVNLAIVFGGIGLFVARWITNVKSSTH